MRVTPEPLQSKRKPRAVSSFLKKTYELLNVSFPLPSKSKTAML